MRKVLLFAAIAVTAWVAESFILEWVMFTVQMWWAMVPAIDFSQASSIVATVNLLFTVGVITNKALKAVEDW